MKQSYQAALLMISAVISFFICYKFMMEIKPIHAAISFAVMLCLGIKSGQIISKLSNSK